VNFWHRCYANISFEYIVRFQGRYLSCAFSISSCNNVTVQFSGFQQWAFKTMGKLSEVNTHHLKVRCSHDGIFLWKWSVHNTVHTGHKFWETVSISCLLTPPPHPITHLSKALIWNGVERSPSGFCRVWCPRSQTFGENGVCKTKLNPIISYKTTILPKSSLRRLCPFVIQTCNARRENGLCLSLSKRKNILLLGSVVSSIGAECVRATRPPGWGNTFSHNILFESFFFFF